MGKIKILILILVYAVFILIINFAFVIFNPNYRLQDDEIFEIEKNATYNDILNNISTTFKLKPYKKFYLDTYLRVKGYDSKMKHGSYSKIMQKEGEMSLEDIISILRKGLPYKEETQITIIEGWKAEEINKYLKEKGLNSDNFLQEINNEQFYQNYLFLSDKPKDVSLEGYLFPDTYNIYSDAVSFDIIDKMLINFGKKVSANMIEDAKANNMSLYETLILASIIEKEVRTYESKQKVSGIFHKRLNDEYPLQSDATVNYITQKGTDRPSLDDLKVESKYNTYKYTGLPPTPICNPGLDSIKAAIYPEENNYYYFLTTQEGDIYFAETYDKHLENKENYLNN